MITLVVHLFSIVGLAFQLGGYISSYNTLAIIGFIVSRLSTCCPWFLLSRICIQMHSLSPTDILKADFNAALTDPRLLRLFYKIAGVVAVVEAVGSCPLLFYNHSHPNFPILTLNQAELEIFFALWLIYLVAKLYIGEWDKRVRELGNRRSSIVTFGFGPSGLD